MPDKLVTTIIMLMPFVIFFLIYSLQLIIQELEGIDVTQESISLFSDHSDEVSKRLIGKSFDLITAYELLSIDIFREKDNIFA